MAEWFKALAWKAGIPQKGIGGSNPPLSTIHAESWQGLGNINSIC